MINEHDLILRARNGDKAAFEEIGNISINNTIENKKLFQIKRK